MSLLTEAADRAAAVKVKPTGETLREMQRVTHTASENVYAVCERVTGAAPYPLVLCIEREVGILGEPDAETGARKRDRKLGTEKVLKPTADLAHFSHAMDAGLL